MTVRIHAGALLIALAAAASAHGASFNCQAAHSPVEHRICDDAALSQLDTQLNDAYHAALAQAADAGTLAREQRAWLATRNRCADAACLDQAYHARLAALQAVKPAEWRRYSNPALGIAFDYPSNRRPVTPCPGTGGKRCVALVGAGMANSDYLVEFNVVDGALEAVAQQEAGFVRNDAGKLMTSFGRGDPVEVERFAGTGWQGMRATVACGVSDPDTGFHAVAGQCFWAVVGDGRHAVVADTQGIVGNDDATARSLASLTFLK